MRRLLIALACTGLLAAPTPSPAETSSSPNMRLVASVPFPRGSDLDFRGSLAFVGSYDARGKGGLYVIDVANPAKPRVVGRFPCSGYQNDVAAWRNTVVLGMHDSRKAKGCSPDEQGGLRILDVTDPAKPRQVSFLEHRPFGTHTVTVVGDTGYVYANPGGLGTLEEEVESLVVDIRNPAKPKVVGRFTPPLSTGCHDVTVVGRRAYCAGSNVTQIWDVTDPVHPTVVSEIYNPAIFFHHSAVPSPDGRTLVISDEAFGTHVCEPGSRVPAGAFWFYDISDERQPALRGYLGPPARDPTVGLLVSAWCTAHNFNMVPGRNWMVASSYSGGTSVIDFSDQANPRVIGWIRPDDANTWSSYFYRGYIFTGDIRRGFDVIAMDELLPLAPREPARTAVKGRRSVRPARGSGRGELPATGVGVGPGTAALLAGAFLLHIALRRGERDRGGGAS